MKNPDNSNCWGFLFYGFCIKCLPNIIWAKVENKKI